MTNSEVENFAILDVSNLVELAGDNEELIASFLEEYRQYVKNPADIILKAYHGQDRRELGRQAHSLKSSSRSVGALALGELCSKLEKAGKKRIKIIYMN